MYTKEFYIKLFHNPVVLVPKPTVRGPKGGLY